MVDSKPVVRDPFVGALTVCAVDLDVIQIGLGVQPFYVSIAEARAFQVQLGAAIESAEDGRPSPDPLAVLGGDADLARGMR